MACFADCKVDRQASTRVRGWARELWAPEVDDAVVSVSELACSDPDCPPHETVILVAGLPGRPTQQHKVQKPLAEVTREDLEHVAHHDQEQHA